MSAMVIAPGTAAARRLGIWLIGYAILVIGVFCWLWFGFGFFFSLVNKPNDAIHNWLMSPLGGAMLVLMQVNFWIGLPASAVALFVGGLRLLSDQPCVLWLVRVPLWLACLEMGLVFVLSVLAGLTIGWYDDSFYTFAPFAVIGLLVTRELGRHILTALHAGA